MANHYSNFLKRVADGKSPNIYYVKAEGKDWYRLYDGDEYHPFNITRHACIDSHLSREAAVAATLLSINDPVRFAEDYL